MSTIAAAGTAAAGGTAAGGTAAGGTAAGGTAAGGTAGTAAVAQVPSVLSAPSVPPVPSAPPVPSVPPAGTGARTAEASALIGGARERIDDLDRRIIALVRERMAVSAGIQQARLASGGRRVHLAREMQVINQYSGALGRPGTALAMTLLDLCRGRV